MTSTHAPAHRPRSTSVPAVIARILVLGVTLAVTVFITPVLIAQQSWMWLAVLLLAAAAIFVLYSTKRYIPGKYLFPGTFFLAVFLIIPIALTVGYSFTNYGDGTRGSKEQAIASIVANSVQQSPDAPRYAMTVATAGSPTEGPFVLYLVDPTDGAVLSGDAETPLAEVPAGDVTVVDGRVTEVAGLTVLDANQVNAVYNELMELAVPVDESSAVQPLGVNQAFVGTTVLQYDEASDTITDTATGEVYTVGTVGTEQAFVDADGKQAFSQGWLQGVGMSNYERLFSNGKIAGQFGAAFVWTLVFAAGSVALTFVVGFALALVLNDERLKGRRIYRSVLIMPYAIPGFISLLVWSNFYNRDFGLINEMLGLDLNWFGDPSLAKVAVLLTNLWMGFPYMFIVSTGALQAIPNELMEASRMDGASRFQTTSKIVLPLLLVAVAPLLVSSFAFNFNNFNAIQLLTEGGPFPDGSTRGATDILISMIYRIAFGGSGADFGFASAVSVCLFILTGVLATIQFRFTNVLEDVN
ncbi:ABC transporter permease subunit [Brachybacterium sp. J144]|uniref:ABC transporter permease subunit n=1 Tax=Brachybacterium sp. J144 TaxID=3116487 RepID=UPI002E7A4800|nr:ABC transporter permease subunit [Brachybacterium sp. J144]MEE1649370.1 ABC transporter permease subunit [Brachybacterium sp. J144]